MHALSCSTLATLQASTDMKPACAELVTAKATPKHWGSDESELRASLTACGTLPWRISGRWIHLHIRRLILANIFQYLSDLGLTARRLHQDCNSSFSLVSSNDGLFVRVILCSSGIRTGVCSDLSLLTLGADFGFRESAFTY